jgi:hypothetical protein
MGRGLKEPHCLYSPNCREQAFSETHLGKLASRAPSVRSRRPTSQGQIEARCPYRKVDELLEKV